MRACLFVRRTDVLTVCPADPTLHFTLRYRFITLIEQNAITVRFNFLIDVSRDIDTVSS
jgi:hypothetical protein